MGHTTSKMLSYAQLSDTSEQGYQYAPLEDDKIRLINLLPGQFDADICFSLRHEHFKVAELYGHPRRLTIDRLQETLPPGWTALESVEGRYFFYDGQKAHYEHPDPRVESVLHEPEAQDSAFIPKFEALSYAWGPVDNPVKVFLLPPDAQDALPSSALATMRIGSNLATALRHLRRSSHSRTLWIDAICINQMDERERARQVPRMRYIYSLAPAIISWLGPTADHSSEAIQLLSHLGEQIELYKHTPGSWLSPQASQPELGKRDIPLPWSRVQWTTVQALFSRPYFERLWVMQEIILAGRSGTVQCGNATIAIPKFRRAVECLFQRTGVPLDMIELVDLVRSTLQYGTRYPFTPLLDQARKRRCALAHDKLYGILSIAPPKLASVIVPNYSLPAVEVFRDFLVHHIRITRRLDLLYLCDSNQISGSSPSWIPISSKPAGKSLSLSFGNHAAGTSSAFVDFPAPGVLEVLGVKVATITDTSRTIPDTRDSALRVLQDCQPEGLHQRTYVNGESALDAYLITLQLDRYRDRFPNFGYIPTLAELRSISDKCQSPEISTVLTNQTLRSLGNSSFVQTSEGYFGFAPDTVQSGDIIYVLLGCFLPLVLRARGSHGHSLVGRCYARGLMDSEALLGPLPPGWIAQRVLEDGFPYPRYFNTATGIPPTEDTVLGHVSQGWMTEDPRLEELPPEWTRDPTAKRAADDPYHCEHFRNLVTGLTVNSDPRLLPEALKERGVKLEKIRLV